MRKIASAYLSLNHSKAVCTPFLKLGPCTSGGGQLALQKSGVARMDIVGSEFSLATQDEPTSEREVPLRLGICYFVVVGRHNIRPCWDIA